MDHSMQDCTKTCMIWLILVFVGMGGLSNKVDAQPAELQFKHITADDGLSHNSVYTIFQDSRGYMWFGTQDGLNRYDGYEIKVYKNLVNDPTSIDNNWITEIFEDSKGNLWVCTSGGSTTASGGLNKYDHDTDSFERVVFSEEQEDVYVVWSITEDHDENIWVGTNDGLFVLADKSERFKKFEHQGEISGSLSHNHINDVYVDRAGIVWIGTAGGGINKYHKETNSFSSYKQTGLHEQGLKSDDVVDVLEDSEGIIWAATRNGLSRLDSFIGDFSTQFFDSERDRGFAGNHYKAIYEDQNHELWAGLFGGGLRKIDRDNGTVRVYRNIPGRPKSLGSDDVHALWQDHAGILWVGTGNGVAYVDLNAGYFSLLRHEGSNKNSLNDNAVKSIYVDPVQEGKLWIGTESGGLNRFDQNTGQVDHFVNRQGDPSSIDNNLVYSVLVDHKGTLWAGTWSGLNKLDRRTGRFTHFLTDHPNHFYKRIRFLYEAPSEPGVLWIAAGGGGLVRFEPISGKLDRYLSDPDDAYTINADWVSAIFEDSKGRLWVGASTGGLNQFHRDTETFTRYQHEYGVSTSLASREVNAITETPDGIIWLATNAGLAKFDAAKNEFYHYTEQNSGIPDNTIVGLLVDNNQLWMSTLKGISKFDPESEYFENYGVEQGLQGRAFNLFAYHKGGDGKFYFGGPNGLNFFSPEEIYGNPVPPKLDIVDFKLFDVSVRPGENSLLAHHISTVNRIELPNNQNDLSFDYVGLHFSNSKKNRYEYMLEKYDRTWREGDASRNAKYTSLNPGNYVFKVRASNANGVWTPAARMIEISVGLPWWRKGWAFIVYAVILGACVFVVDRYQRIRLLRKERETAQIREAELRAQAAQLKARALEAENDRKEIELKKAEQLKEAYDALQESMNNLKRTQRQLVQAEKMASLGQLTAGIAHEIKNPLNFVINFAGLTRSLVSELGATLFGDEHAIDKDRREEIQDMISMLELNAERINEHGLRADSIVQGMMEHSRPSVQEAEPTNLTRTLDLAIDLALNGLKIEFADIKFDIIREYDESIGNVNLIPQDFTRVIINILDNALYAVREYAAGNDDEFKPEIVVYTAREGKNVVIKISDNGPGISEETKAKIFDPFFTTKPAGSGNTGLGLSLSHDIISQGHHGSLEVESEPGKGTTFIIRIPS